jgi:hypothetical protein
MFTLNTTGVNASLTGTWSIAQNATHLDLVYTLSAILEPVTRGAFFGGGALTLALLLKRRLARQPRVGESHRANKILEQEVRGERIRFCVVAERPDGKCRGFQPAGTDGRTLCRRATLE